LTHFKKKDGKQAFSAISDCHLLENKIKLPKVKLIKFRGGKIPNGKAKMFSILRDAAGYYASILFDDGQKDILEQGVNNVLGIDLGIKDFAILSNGKKREQAKKIVGKILLAFASRQETCQPLSPICFSPAKRFYHLQEFS